MTPYCLAHCSDLTPFSPNAGGFLPEKVTANTNFPHSDNVRKLTPWLRRENPEVNQPPLDLLVCYAQQKAPKAQISLGWTMHKSAGVVLTPSSENQERILENPGV